MLRTRYVTYATRANLNNLVGVPLTILEAPEDTEALVVEAGANLPGEIARYREIIAPDVVVITNAVAGHLEGFGSLEGVLEEKLSLSDWTWRSPSSEWIRRHSPKVHGGGRDGCAPPRSRAPISFPSGSRSAPTPGPS